MSNANIVPFSQPATPAVPFGDMQRLAEAVAKSGLFGIKTPDQALALMALAQAEGRHPATVARDYHIINGSPSKKAEAMQRDFLMAGGKIEWHEMTDDAADATFSHPIGGTVRIRWDKERVAQAQLGGNQMHKKYPRQMLRSRVVSEGVRTVWPLATSGMYVPEEVTEFAAQAPADTRADLDAFAAKPAEIVDAETGEVLDAAAIERDARAAAAQGTHVFRGHLREISREARAILNGKVGTREEPGELLILAMKTDNAARAADTAADELSPNSPAGEDQPSEQKGVTLEADDALPRPAGELRARDEEWWNDPVLVIAAKTPREFQAEMHVRVREARNWAEVERLRDDNGQRIDALDRATKEAVLGMLADRERELRANG